MYGSQIILSEDFTEIVGHIFLLFLSTFEDQTFLQKNSVRSKHNEH